MDNSEAHHNPSWTIDRERDIYLRYMTSGHEDFANHWTFTFFWKGLLFSVELEISGGGKHKGPVHRYYKLFRLYLPRDFKPHEAEVIADLKDALIAFRDCGVRSVSTQCTVTFDF